MWHHNVGKSTETYTANPTECYLRKSSNNAVSHEKLNTETVPCKLSEGHRVFCTVVKSRLGHVEQWRGTYILTVNR